MDSDIERVAVDDGGRQQDQGARGVERGESALAAAAALESRFDRRRSFGEERAAGGGLRLMRGWGATQQVRINPTNETSSPDLSLDLARPDLADESVAAHEDDVQVRLPPPNLFSDMLGGMLRHADRVDAAKQGSWRFFLLFLYSVFLTLFILYSSTLVLQYVYGIYVDNFASVIRVLNIGNIAKFDKDRLKVISSQMVPFSVQSTNADALRLLLAGPTTGTTGVYLGAQSGDNFQTTSSFVNDVTGNMDITSQSALRLNSGSSLIQIDSSQLALGCSSKIASTGTCLAVNGSVTLGRSIKNSVSVRGPMGVNGLLTTKNVKIMGRCVCFLLLPLLISKVSAPNLTPSPHCPPLPEKYTYTQARFNQHDVLFRPNSESSHDFAHLQQPVHRKHVHPHDILLC
jgi:hypothetical protein